MENVFTKEDFNNYKKIEKSYLEYDEMLRKRASEVYIKVYEEYIEPTDNRTWTLNWLYTACKRTLNKTSVSGVSCVGFCYDSNEWYIEATVYSDGCDEYINYTFKDFDIIFDDSKLDSYIQTLLKRYELEKKSEEEEKLKKELQEKLEHEENEWKEYERLKAKFEGS